MRSFISHLLTAILGGAIVVVFLYFYAPLNLGNNKTEKFTESVFGRHISNRFPDSANIFDEGFGDAAAKSLKPVVHITSEIVFSGKNPLSELLGEGFWDNSEIPIQIQQATGSGVILSADGYIVTNNHVVEQAREIIVSLYNNRNYKAKIIGTDPSTDLAVLKIDEKDLPSTIIANSDNVRVGDWVLAVGNPFNLASTVTAGIVSAKARNIHILRDNSAIESFIQTDAAVNPGNSGGALVNMDGELIGINTAIATPTGTYAGYSFAVPSNIVKKVVGDIIKFGEVQRGYLGVMIRDLNWDLVEKRKLKISEGVWVDQLVKNGAANKAGIKPGDVIVKIGKRQVKNTAELIESVARHKPGDIIPVTINREGKEQVIQVKLQKATITQPRPIRRQRD